MQPKGIPLHSVQPRQTKRLDAHQLKQEVLPQNCWTLVSGWCSSTQWKKPMFFFFFNQNTQVSHRIIHTWKQRQNSSNKLSTRDSFPWALVEKAAGNREQTVSISLYDTKQELTRLWFMENQGLFGDRSVYRSCARGEESKGFSSVHHQIARANTF